MKAVSVSVKHLRELVACEDLCLASDGKTIVRASDKRAAFVLAKKGQVISEKDAARFGIAESLSLDEPEQPEQPSVVAPADVESRANRREKPSATR